MFEHLVPFGGPVWTCLGRMLNFLEVAFGLEKDRQPFGKSLPLLMEMLKPRAQISSSSLPMLHPESLPQRCPSRAISPQRCKEKKCTSFDKGCISLLHRHSRQGVSSLCIPHSSSFNLWGQAIQTVWGQPPHQYVGTNYPNSVRTSHPNSERTSHPKSMRISHPKSVRTSHPNSVRAATPTVCQDKPPQKCEDKLPNSVYFVLVLPWWLMLSLLGMFMDLLKMSPAFFVQFLSVHLCFVAYLWSLPLHFIDYFLCLARLQYSTVFAFVTEFWGSYSQITTRTEAKKLPMPAVSLCHPGLAWAITM